MVVLWELKRVQALKYKIFLVADEIGTVFCNNLKLGELTFLCSFHLTFWPFYAGP